MKTSVKTGELSLHPSQGSGRGVKIGGEHGGGTEKRRFGTAKRLDVPCGGEKIVKNRPQQFIDAMNNKSNGKSRIRYLR